MIIRGSLNYTTSGRKKKSYTKKRKTKEFVPMFPKKDLEFKPTWWEKERQGSFFLGQTQSVSFIKKILVVSIQ